MSRALVDFRRIEQWWRSSHPKKPPAHSPPIDREPWLKQLDMIGVPRHLTYPSTTLSRVLDQTAERFSEATSMVYGERSWTYGQLQAQVNRFAGALAGLGVRKEDRVLLTLPNCPEFIVAFFAIQKLGAVVVNVGPLMGVDDVEKVIALTSPRVIIGLDLQSPMLCQASHGSSVQHAIWISLSLYQPVLKRLGYQFKLWQQPGHNGDKPHHHSLTELMKLAPARPPTVDPEPTAVALLQATGGTTGTLKLVQLSHRNLLANAAQVAVWMGSRLGQERHLAVLPMFHVYGLTTCLMSAIYTGASVILATRFHARETIELLRQHKPTLFPLVPTICHTISEVLAENPETAKLEGLKLCVSGAAPLSVEISERFTKLTGVPIIEGFGLTEAGPVTHVNVPGKPRAGSIGLPLPDTRIRIVDLDQGETEVAPGEAGELLIAGPQIMSGYFANPKESDRVLTTDIDGTIWLHTGDVARCDADGYFYIVDRKKDMIIRSGLKVYPAKVEKVLMMHAHVADAAVIGRPDPIHTESVVAILTRKNLHEPMNGMVEELRALCREHLAPYEVPATFEVVEQIPRSALGKVLKRELRKGEK